MTFIAIFNNHSNMIVLYGTCTRRKYRFIRFVRGSNDQRPCLTRNASLRSLRTILDSTASTARPARWTNKVTTNLWLPRFYATLRSRRIYKYIKPIYNLCGRILKYFFTWFHISISYFESERGLASSSQWVLLYREMMSVRQQWKETMIVAETLIAWRSG
jgi:hypothetical protein